MSNEQYYKKATSDKSRKFRWSSCFSFINKFKKQKPTNDKQIRLSQSFQNFEQQKQLVLTETSLSENTKQKVEQEKPQWRPSPSLSPPPRQSKSKRESINTQQEEEEEKDTRNRRPLLDPTLTPRVKPRSIKSKKQPSLLRLSLDAEFLSITDKEDNDSFIKSGHSSVSLTPTGTLLPNTPFRTGTLGVTINNSPRISAPLPPLPNYIPHHSFIDSSSSRNSSQLISDSPISISAIKFTSDEDDDKLTLKERRRRRSPLSIPNSDKLTLALNEMVDQQDQTIPSSDRMKRQTYDLHNIYMNHDNIWHPEEDKSREETMLILEGKKKKNLPIMPLKELDRLFEKSNDDTRTTQKSYEEKGLLTKNINKLDMITENKIAANYSTRHTHQLIPETPPHHKQTAPSLISSPSTPNSIDSSVLEQDDFYEHSKPHPL